MKAITYSKYGKSDVLEYKEVSLPILHDDEVRIKSYATSVNPVDWKIRSGILRFIPLYKLPITPGMDVAGEIDEVGAKVTGFQKGDRVFAFLSNRGGYAEMVTTKAEFVVQIPDSVTYEEAACVPLAGLTAIQSLRLGKIKKGDKVLINGAAGGVGFLAVQIAKDLGAEVTAVCRAVNFEFVAQANPDKLIDHEKVDFTKQNEKYDIVFDAVAKRSFGECLKIMKSKSTMISTMPNNKFLLYKIISFFLPKKLYFVLVKNSQDDMQYLSNLLLENKLITHIEHRYSLKEAAAAMDMNEFGRVKGKVIISTSQID